MKTIYFARHGESEGNLSSAWPGPENDKLTEKGRAQAEVIAERCARLPIEFFLSSTLTRTTQTAEIISKKIGKPFEQSELFVEVRRPTALHGKIKDDPETKKLHKFIMDNFTVSGFRHSDEENFDDLKQRVKDALAYLVARPEEHILVTTHGFFMRAVAAYVTFGDTLTATECQKFMQTFHTANTGITVLGYDESKSKPWWVWVWNDHAHLAELENV